MIERELIELLYFLLYIQINSVIKGFKENLSLYVYINIIIGTAIL